MTIHISSTEPYSAIEISKWFIQEGLDKSCSKKDGNIKVQKLLFFSWLIHFQKFGKSLFDDDFSAFPKGPVVESVRKSYYDLSADSVPAFSENIIETLNLTKDIFGDTDVNELIDLSHRSPAWQKYSKISLQKNAGGSKFNYDPIIPKTELDEEIRMIGNVLYVQENMLSDSESV
ncbi:MAG: Panacea domain-containing protein [Methanimicrococcus sp.]|nr:Panacea domain-containing protein [Methanimicrococcus sp.]